MAVSRAQETILETNEAETAAQLRKTQRAQEMILRAMKALSAAQKQKIITIKITKKKIPRKIMVGGEVLEGTLIRASYPPCFKHWETMMA